MTPGCGSRNLGIKAGPLALPHNAEAGPSRSPVDGSSALSAGHNCPAPPLCSALTANATTANAQTADAMTVNLLRQTLWFY